MVWSLTSWRQHSGRLAYFGLVISITVMSTMYIQEQGALVRSFSSDLLTGEMLDLHPRLDEVRDIVSFWEYMEFTLFPSVFYNELHGTESLTAEYPIVDAMNSTRLVGDIAISTSRVNKDEGCGVSYPFTEVFGHCFSENFQSVNKTTYNGYVFSKFFSPISPIPSSESDRYYQINDGGFVVSPLTIDSLNELKTDYIEDEKNRVIFVFLTFFHQNSAIFNSVRIQFEITSSGGWIRNVIYQETVETDMLNPLEKMNFFVTFILSILFLSILIVIELLQFFVSKTLKEKGLLYIIILLAATQLGYIVLSPNFPSVTPSGFFNSWSFFWHRNWITGITSVLVFLLFLELLSPIIVRPVFFIPAISLVCFAAAFTVVEGNRFSNWVQFVFFSNFGISNWEFTSVGAGICIYIFCLLTRLILLPVIISQLVSDFKFRDFFSTSFSLEKIPFALPFNLKFYAPGLYYRYVVAESDWQFKVGKARSKRECALLPAQVPNMDASNLYSIQIAVEDVKEKLKLVLDLEIKDVLLKINEMEKMVHSL